MCWIYCIPTVLEVIQPFPIYPGDYMDEGIRKNEIPNILALVNCYIQTIKSSNLW